ncbi:tetratricopeptide repeat protein [Oribacterium sp. FC2011]|uniref:tetratricopeptide repeat protein n=1 Tax=Oribacterium sp. FC2011 TaxID=1408311 RepID=UPI0004E13FC0|nr:tetratricopeptide repeat protein [Oribacterium sp. FC2011]
MEKKSSPIIIISIVTGILLVSLVGILVYFNLPAQRIRRMLKTANKYIAEENYEEAILTLQKMLEIDPKNEDIYVLLADTYEKNGDIDKEVEFLQEAVTLMPENRKISEVLTDVYPEVTISESEGTYKDPIRLTLDASEDSKIYYIITGTGVDGANSAGNSGTGNKENEYNEPIPLENNGKYSIEYYAVSKNGYEGEHKTATYVIELDTNKYHFNEWVDEADGRHFYDADGISVTGWKKIGELWYLFDKTGVMLTGLQEDDGKNYYLGTDGTMLVDTVTPDGKKVGKDGKKIDEAWKQAYIDVINGGDFKLYDSYYKEYSIKSLQELKSSGFIKSINESNMFSENWFYAYIDKDDIPELIYTTLDTYNSLCYILFTYSNGSVQSIGFYNDFPGCQHLSYKNRGNLIYADMEGASEICGLYSYRIGSKGFEVVHEIEAIFSGSADVSDEFIIDGTSVTYEQIGEKASQYFNEPDMLTSIDNSSPWCGSYGNNSSSWGTWEGNYSSSEIIDIIRNM